MSGWLRAGGVALILCILVFANRSLSEPEKAPPAPRSRIALINLSFVMKNYQKYKNFQSEIKADVARYQKKDQDIRDQIARLSKESEDTQLALPRKTEIEKTLKKVKRDLEDNNAEAKDVLGKKSDAQMVILYKEIQQAAQDYAKAHEIEMVLHYNDADAKLQSAEYWSPSNVARKMQAGSCMPLYVAPGLDITADLITALNASRSPK